MFAELMVPKFSDKEFKSHFRLDRRSIEVCYLSLRAMFKSTNLMKMYTLCYSNIFLNFY